MADDTLNSDFFQKVFKIFRSVFSPLEDVFSSDDARADFLSSLGLDPATDIGNLPSLTQLDAYINSSVEDTDSIALTQAIGELIQLTAAFEGMIRVVASDNDDAGFALDEFTSVYFNVLLMDYVRRTNPPVHAFAQLVSVINANTAAIGGSLGIATTIKEFGKRIAAGLESPESAAAVSQTVFAVLGLALWLIDKYAIKDSDAVELKLDFGYDGFEGTATPIADEAADRTITYSVTAAPFDDPATRATFYNSLVFVPEAHGGGALVTELAGVVDVFLPVNDKISFKIEVDGDGVFRIGERPAADAGNNNKLALTFKHKLPDDFKTKTSPAPVISIGLKEYTFKVTLKPDELDINLKAKLPFEFKRDPEATFPETLLPKQTKKDIELELGYSTKRDFYFGSGGGNPNPPPAEDGAVVANADEPDLIEEILAKLINMIDLRLAINKDVGGVVGIEVLNIKAGVDGNFETITIETSIDFWVKFTSAVKVSISRLGAELVFTDRDEIGGFLGYDVDVNFKPPTGAGLVVNAGAVKGGGYLYFDKENGEYYGALELDIEGFVTLKAIGIINTIMLDGSDGFSMLVMVSGGFAPLAGGFTLDAIGGLLGVDRTINVEALRVGLRTNAIRSLMFPEDIVGNMSRILNDIREFFPIKEGQFAVGLMAQIGYGGSNFFKMEIGVIVEFPNPKILILGVIRVLAPSEEAEALRVQVNFLGLIDTVNEFFYFEAHLYDSHIAGIELTGSLAMVIGWGDNGMFALSLGGFHPDFRDYPAVPTLPGAFREMDRIGLSLLSGRNPTLTVQCYFAITSNTVQFGARLELLASGPSSFNVYGMLSFDALFIRDPFSFTISIEATLAIRRRTKILFGISFRGTLSGPNPWNIDGQVSFGILFFDITIPVRATWGNELEIIASETTELVSLLRQELNDERNWQGKPGARLHHTVTHRVLDALEENDLVVFPFGELGFSQRLLPLNYDIEKYGDKIPEGATRLGIRSVKIDGETFATEVRKELFAAGNFSKLTENEKLSRKSFERFDSGFKLRGSDALKTSPRTVAPVMLDYELNYTDDDKPDPVVAPLAVGAFNHLVRHASVARGDMSWVSRQAEGLNAVQAVQIIKDAEDFVIASADTLLAVDVGVSFSTFSEATRAMNDVLANDPELNGQLQIVQNHELRR